MPKQNNTLLAFNRGIISRLGVARTDLNRAAMSAETMTNWLPRVLGSMSIRPGMEYIGATADNAKSKTFPFIFASDDLAAVEITEGVMRVWVDDELVTRETVTAAITNGSFTSNLTGWTDSDEVGATSDWLTGGYMTLLGDGTNAAIRDQTVTVNEANTEHALRITINSGPVTLRVGSTSGGDEYITETSLGTGTHSLTFTPTGNFYIRLQSRLDYTTIVDSIAVESAGTMELTVPWQEEDLPYIRMVQSGDIMYVACDGYQQRKIERRSATSWSVVLYAPETGPFRNLNTGPVTITPSALTGDITLTASATLFRSSHVGALFKIQSSGQTVSESINAQNVFSDPIRVSGVEGQRSFGITITGTFSATLTLQYSVGEPGNWVDVTTYTTELSTSYLDGLDNQIIYYRIGVKTGAFTSGPVVATLSYTSGSITGIARVTAYTSGTVVNAVVLTDMGAVTASSDWWEGAWSSYRGWPSAVTLYEGRLWWAGNDFMYGSISDAYEDFDADYEGDAGPIVRSIGEGPVENIAWLLPLNRLMVGTTSTAANVAALKIDGNNPLSGRSSSFDEPLTPTNFNLKNTSVGGMFVQRSRQRLLSLNFDVNESDYMPEDLTIAVPDLNEAGIAHIAVQYMPDMRVHCVRDDGTVAIMVRDKAENVICWVEFETDGYVEDVYVLPGDLEDLVYYTVRRTINGSTVRYHEKWALLSECRGQPVAKLADAFGYYSGSETTTITGLSHLEGEEVVCWGWNTTTPFTNDDGDEVGKDFGTFTVSSGQITGLSDAVTNACVGLAYTASFKSAKQAFAAAMGTPLNQTKKIDQVGFILADTHKLGLRFGPDFDTLDDLPLTEGEEDVGDDHIWVEYDKDMTAFPGEWNTDSRFCLEGAAPRPVTVLAVTTSMTVHG
jgi:hypothetical protein